jgi:hypothetical protein
VRDPNRVADLKGLLISNREMSPKTNNTMGDDLYGNYLREYAKCFNRLLSAAFWVDPYAVRLTMEQILHFDFKGQRESGFTCRWSPALADH